MSHYTQISVKFKERAPLIKALKTLGFSAEQIQSFEKAVQLEDYSGKKRELMAHIIIPRKFVGQSCNDMGFALDEYEDGVPGGTYICDYSRSRERIFNPTVQEECGGFNDVFLDRLAEEYASNIAIEEAEKNGQEYEKQYVQDESGRKRVKVFVGA